MKHLLLLALPLLAACTEENFPKDVTPHEVSLKEECVTVAKRHLPANVSIDYVSIERHKDEGTGLIGINREGPAAFCMYEKHQLYIITLMPGPTFHKVGREWK